MGPPMPHPQYPQYPNYVPGPSTPFPPQQVIYVRDPSHSTRRARKVEELAGRRTKKRKSNDLSQLIKISRLSSTPVRRRDQSGPSGINPGPPRSSSPPVSIARSSGSKIGSNSHHSSEEEENSSDDAQSFESTESESEGTEYSDNESQQLSDTTSAGLRRKLHRYIQRERDGGEMGLMR